MLYHHKAVASVRAPRPFAHLRRTAGGTLLARPLGMCLPDDTRVRRGRLAEELAAAFLALSGFRLLGRNVRDGPREIDLVATIDGWAVVVEVRYRSMIDRGRPEESVGRRKQTHLLRAGRSWWLREGRAHGPLRFDLLAIEREPRGLILRHYPHFMNPDRRG